MTNEETDLLDLFEFNGTPVKAKPALIMNIPMLWAGFFYYFGRQHPEWSWEKRASAGLLSTLSWLAADIGHALAHTVSARGSGFPMDEIRIVDMPRTIYYENDIPAKAHRMRALGGPVYSALGFLISRLLRRLVERWPFADCCGAQPAIDQGGRLHRHPHGGA